MSSNVYNIKIPPICIWKVIYIECNVLTRLYLIYLYNFIMRHKFSLPLQNKYTNINKRIFSTVNTPFVQDRGDIHTYESDKLLVSLITHNTIGFGNCFWNFQKIGLMNMDNLMRKTVGWMRCV